MPGGIPDDEYAPPAKSGSMSVTFDWGTSDWDKNRNWNAIVPINVYNVREGRINTSLAGDAVYERGITKRSRNQYEEIWHVGSMASLTTTCLWVRER